MEEVVLKLQFNIEYIDCVSYRCVSKSYWESILRILKTNHDIEIQPYSNPSPMELYGDSMDSKTLMEEICVISDPILVKAFKTFHGESFCNDIDVFDDLFEKCEEVLSKSKSKSKSK